MPERMTVEIQAQVSWNCFQDPKSKRWVGICDALKITVGAESWPELAEVIDDTLQAMMLTLWEGREFDEFLRKRGWTALQPMPKETATNVEFDIPLQLMKGHARDYAPTVH